MKQEFEGSHHGYHTRAERYEQCGEPSDDFQCQHGGLPIILPRVLEAKNLRLSIWRMQTPSERKDHVFDAARARIPCDAQQFPPRCVALPNVALNGDVLTNSRDIKKVGHAFGSSDAIGPHERVAGGALLGDAAYYYL